MFIIIEVEIGQLIVRIRSDRVKEFDNVDVDLFCDSKGIKHEFLAPRTQCNGVVERKKIVLQGITRVMIHIYNTPYAILG